MTDQMREVAVRTAELLVEPAMQPGGKSGVAFAVINDGIVMAITKDGEGLCIALKGDAINQVAGMFADAVMEATRHDAPSLRSVQ